MWKLLVAACGSSSLTRVGTQAPALEAQSLSHWTTREIASICLKATDTKFLLATVTPFWTASQSFCCSIAKSCPTRACQAPLSHYLLEFMSIESVMLSNHLILCCLLLLLPSIFPSIKGKILQAVQCGQKQIKKQKKKKIWGSNISDVTIIISRTFFLTQIYIIREKNKPLSFFKHCLLKVPLKDTLSQIQSLTSETYNQ